MEPTLADHIRADIANDTHEGKLTAEEEVLAVAALAGDEALDAALTGDSTPAPASTPHTRPRSSKVRLQSISVTGFRGIGATAELAIEPGNGITLVVGSNGSGKSSFAEGLETLLTGTNQRWQDKRKTWQTGWRNLHVSDRIEIAAELTLEGQSEPLHARRWWTGSDITDQTSEVTLPGGFADTIDVLGWAVPLEDHRPFLSYNELGSVLDSPTTMYDSMSRLLGLDLVVTAQKRLQQRRLDKEKPGKALKSDTTTLVDKLTTSNDPRAVEAVSLLRGKRPDLERLAAIGDESATGADHTDGQHLSDLEVVSNIEVASDDGMKRAADELSDAIDAVTNAAGDHTSRARRMVSLLESAKEHQHETGDERCPVCGAEERLNGHWRANVDDEIERWRSEAAAASERHDNLKAAHANAQALLGAPPAALGRVFPDAADQWEQWHTAATATSSSVALLPHLRGFGSVRETIDQAKMQSKEQLTAYHQEWRPHQLAITNWLEQARVANVAAADAKRLGRAEDWFKAKVAELRTERFAPISQQANHFWDLLKHRSNVELGALTLEGSSNRRRLELAVTVDGEEATAQGVMSQGELHALALSLFLPRATMPESPFQFVLIDDPVQAMDPAKVDGLARALETVAAHRQVIVFTHDDRLAESLRRLQIPADVYEVTRRRGSQVSVNYTSDPVDTALNDARALSLTRDLDDAARTKVVPGYCRQALEAAATATIRRRRIGRGEPHHAVDKLLAEESSLRERLALAVTDERIDRKASDWLDTLVDSLGQSVRWVIAAANAGAHGDYNGGAESLPKLIDETSALANHIRKLQ